MGHEAQIEPWSPTCPALCFAGFGTDRLRCEQAMKTAERENPNRRPQCVANRADGAASQYRSCSIMWAAKQENFQPAEKCFFLTSPFIELTGHLTYQDFTCPVSAFTRHWPNLTLIPVPTAILAHRRLCWVFQYLSR